MEVRKESEASVASISMSRGGVQELPLRRIRHTLIIFLTLITVSRGQMALPFTGQGGNPEEPVDVHVSALMERLLSVDDKEYRFEAIIYIYLSWVAPSAWEAMPNATNAFRDGTLEECQRPCSFDGVNLSRKSKGYFSEVSCCDNVWLPSIGMFNVYDLPE